MRMLVLAVKVAKMENALILNQNVMALERAVEVSVCVRMVVAHVAVCAAQRSKSAMLEHAKHMSPRTVSVLLIAIARQDTIVATLLHGPAAIHAQHLMGMAGARSCLHKAAGPK